MSDSIMIHGVTKIKIKTSHREHYGNKPYAVIDIEYEKNGFERNRVHFFTDNIDMVKQFECEHLLYSDQMHKTIY